MICPWCGAEVPVAKTCENCGNELADGRPVPKAAFVLVIVGLVLSLVGLGFFPGFICCVIGLVLNAGYGKQGRDNKHRTSTLVIGIIGIVVSVLVFATLVAGVALVASMDEDDFYDDADDVAQIETEDEDVLAEEADEPSRFIGSWTLVKLKDGDDSVDKEQIQHMEDSGLSVNLDIKDDGTARFSVFDEPLDGVWKELSDSSAVLILEGEAIQLKIQGKELVLTNQDNAFAFTRADAAKD